MANTYDIGDLIRCSATFTNAAGTPIDPTVVVFQVKDPSGNVTSYTYGTDPEVIKSDTGDYYVDVSIDEVGDWWFRWYSTGTGQAAGEQKFTIRTRHVSP